MHSYRGAAIVEPRIWAGALPGRTGMERGRQVPRAGSSGLARFRPAAVMIALLAAMGMGLLWAGVWVLIWTFLGLTLAAGAVFAHGRWETRMVIRTIAESME